MTRDARWNAGFHGDAWRIKAGGGIAILEMFPNP